MSKKDPVDVTRTDEAYWKRVLDAEGLGMNRGTTFSEEDKAAMQSERERLTDNKDGRGRPFKRGPKGPHLQLNKNETEKASRFTYLPREISGVFQLGGFRHYGPSLPFGAGRGKKGGRRGPEDYGHFITYVGDSYNLARLEESLSLEEAGRVTSSGYGADR